MYNTYEYVGPVMEFGKCIADRWKGITKAENERKAKSNLAYQFKTATNRSPRCSITLPGKLQMIN